MSTHTVAKPIHNHSCDEWCNHCTVCGTGVLYGSLCHDHGNKPTPLEPASGVVL